MDQADLVENSTITPENEQNNTIDFTPDGELDHLMLMYEDDRTVPLGPDEYVLVHFMTVDEKEGEEEESLLHYAIRVYGDGTIRAFIDGIKLPLKQRQFMTGQHVHDYVTVTIESFFGCYDVFR